MILWSIQPRSVLDIIKRGNEFRCDGRKSQCLRTKYRAGGWEEAFHEPYKWMVRQMKERGIQDDNRYPVWAWHTYHSADKGRKAPRIRQLKKYCSGEFRLKLSVPDELVLLSDFDRWHEPLNNMFCGSSRYILKMMSMENNKRWTPEKFKKHKEKSWVKIFDNFEGRGIQACFPSIKPEYLLKSEII